MEEPSSVDTRGRNFCVGFNGKTFFRSSSTVCLAEEVLPWDSPEEGFSAVDITTAKKDSFVKSCRRTSSESVTGRTLFLKNKNAQRHFWDFENLLDAPSKSLGVHACLNSSHVHFKPC